MPHATADDLKRLRIRLAIADLETKVAEVKTFTSRLCEETFCPTQWAVREKLVELRTEINTIIRDVNELEA